MFQRRRFTSHILTPCLSFLLVGAMLFSSLVRSGSGQTASPSATQSTSPKGESGPPRADMPSLDEIRKRRDPNPQAPPAVHSIMRGRRKPVETRNGLKVGDPGTQGANQTPVDQGGASHVAATNGPGADSDTGVSSKKTRSSKLNHAARRSGVGVLKPS